MKSKALLVCLVVLLCLDQIYAGMRIKSFLLKQKRLEQESDPAANSALQIKLTDNNPFVRKTDDDALKPAAGDKSLSSRLQRLEAKTAIRQAYETVQDIVHDVLSHSRTVSSPSDSSPPPSSPSDSLAPLSPDDGTVISNGRGQTTAAANPANAGKIIGDIDGQQQPTAATPTPTATTTTTTAAAPAPAAPLTASSQSKTAVPAPTIVAPPVQTGKTATNPNVPPPPLEFDPDTAPQKVLSPVVHPGIKTVPETKMEELEDNREQMEAAVEEEEAQKIVTPEGGVDRSPTQQIHFPVTVGPKDLPAETTRSVIMPTDKPPIITLRIPSNLPSDPKMLKDIQKDTEKDDASLNDIAKDIVRIDDFVPHHIHLEDQS